MQQHPILRSYVVDYFREIVVTLYGVEKGRAIAAEHKQLCLEYAAQYSDISKAEEQHYFEQILPFVAAYKVMQKHDASKANDVLQTIMERRSALASKILRGLLKVPFLYRKVPAICNALVVRSFSEEAGFAYGDIVCSKTAWKANIIRCPYVQTCQQLDCPEIAHYFCDSDDIIYGNLHKRIMWKRTKTLGRGDSVCDFHVEIK